MGVRIPPYTLELLIPDADYQRRIRKRLVALDQQLQHIPHPVAGSGLQNRKTGFDSLGVCWDRDRFRLRLRRESRSLLKQEEA